MTMPSGWTMAQIGDFTIERVAQGEPEHLVPYVDIGSIDRDLKRVGPVESVDEATAPTRARQWLQARDVLVSLTRPNLNAVALVPEQLGGSVASTGFDVLRTLQVMPEWLFARVRSQDFVSDVCKDVQGVVYPAIRPDDVRRHQMPLPPHQEQKRIVEAIDSYLSRLDAAVANLERVKAKLKAYRASVLKAAVEGRLVPTETEVARQEKRSYEPAEALLARILMDRRLCWEKAELAKLKKAGKAPKDDKWKANYEEPLPPDTTKLPELPEGWCWARAEQVSEFITKGTTPTKGGMTAGVGEVPYIKVYNLTFDGSLNFTQDPTFVSRETHEGFLSRSLCEPGDVLMNIVGPPLGKVSIVPPTHPEWNINQAIARYKPLAGIATRYFAYVLLGDQALRWAVERAKTTAGQVNLTLEIARDLPIPVPPEAEQERIVDELDRKLSAAAATSDIIATNVTRSRRLRQAVLKWAFEGKLVDQDPGDEPADKLLARIHAERSAAGPTTKTRGRKAKAAS